MKKRLIFLLVGILALTSLTWEGRVCFGASGSGAQQAGPKITFHNIKVNPPGNVRRYGNMRVARDAFARLDTSNYDKEYLLAGKGICNYAEKATGKALISAIKAGSSLTWGYAGFQTFGFINAGTSDWPNVTITATIHVKETISSGLMICVSFFDSGGMPWVDSFYNQSISAPGTYTITSHPIPIKPGHTYCAFAALACEAFNISGDMAGVSAVIRSIKINL